VTRLKRGVPSTHPLRGPELRALRQIQRDYPASAYVFTTERGGPLTGSTVRKIIARAGRVAKLGFPLSPTHAQTRNGLLLSQQRGRYPLDPALPGAQEYFPYGPLHGADARQV